MRRLRGMKNFICIEAWDQDSIEPKPTMKPLLDFITLTNSTKYSYDHLHTPEELEYVLKRTRTAGFSLLYLAMHGKPEKVYIGAEGEFEISLSKLSKMMGRRFAGMGIHFGSCAVMSSAEETLTTFMNDTGVTFLSGYTEYVDFQTSSIVDHILFINWFASKNFKRMFERMRKSHKNILNENGFKYIA